MKSKFILDLSDKEILQEVSEILNIDIKPFKITGRIADSKNDYVKDGIVDEKKLHELYENGKYTTEYIITLATTSLRNRAPDLFSLIKKCEECHKVLEYGCGTSTHGIAAAQLGSEVHIVDISKTMLDFASLRYQRRNLNVTRYEPGHNIPKNYFDRLFCTDVLEHVLDPVKLLKDFIRYLKIGGVAHLHCSKKKNYIKGHLPQSIDDWFGNGIKILNEQFEKISQYNYKLRVK